MLSLNLPRVDDLLIQINNYLDNYFSFQDLDILTTEFSESFLIEVKDTEYKKPTLAQKHSLCCCCFKAILFKDRVYEKETLHQSLDRGVAVLEKEKQLFAYMFAHAKDILWF